MDKSNGYEKIATIFMNSRGIAYKGVGSSTVRNWIRTSLKPNSTVLDLACGTGIPNSKILIDEGMTVYAIDASPTLVEAYRKNFPNNPIACEAAEETHFFNRKFDGILAWGLLFLLPTNAQETVIQNCANALASGGKFVFTSPPEKIEWNDAMTDQPSISLGAQKYRELISQSGLHLLEEFDDEGGNYYYCTVKP